VNVTTTTKTQSSYRRNRTFNAEAQRTQRKRREAEKLCASQRPLRLCVLNTLAATQRTLFNWLFYWIIGRLRPF
jgi:hypothetical protein